MKRNLLRLSIPFVFLLTICYHSAFADDIPLNFTYQFSDVDPVKIYAGAVTFSHGTHITNLKISCVHCHHDIEAGDTQVNNSCRDCHTEEGFPRFEEAASLSEEEKIEYYLVALHQLCIDCHIDTKRKVTQSRPPISCTRCHLVKNH
jgi:hypothetical protein